MISQQERSSEWTIEWALEQAAALGVLPTDAYHQTVSELNLFLERRNIRESEKVIETSWRTINFLGGFFSGKLGALDRYMPKTPKRDEEEEQRVEAMVDGLAKLGFKR